MLYLSIYSSENYLALMNTLIEYSDRATWRKHAHLFGDYNYRQLWEYERACADRWGAKSEHVAITHNEEVLAMASVRLKRIPFLGTGVAYISGGPLVRKDTGQDSHRLATCLRRLRSEYVEKRGFVLRINAPTGSPDWVEAQNKAFVDAGYRQIPSAKTYRTFMLNIDQPLEAIRRQFSHQWRTNLNTAERMGTNIVTRQGTDLFADFLTLYHQLRERKQFAVDLDATFYATMQSCLSAEEQLYVSIAKVDDRSVAGQVSSMLGDTCVVLLTASNAEGLQHRASFLLQWHTILHARTQGLKWYDLGGIDPVGNPGVYRYKKGMGGADITAPGPFECVPAGMNRYIVAGSERLYRLFGNSSKPRR